MIFRLSEIAEKIGAELVGPDREITGLSTIENPLPGTITFLTTKKYRKKLLDCPCAGVIVPPGIKSETHSLLVKDDPYLGFGQAMRLFYRDHARPDPAVMPTAAVAASASLGRNVFIGHNAIIENGARVGDNSIIHAGAYIGENAVLGEGCIIYPNAVLMHDIVVGDRVVIYAGAVIGSDGFGYARKRDGFVKIPQAGTVVIEDDVEIGANACIDRAKFGTTLIQRGNDVHDALSHKRSSVKSSGSKAAT